MSTELDLLKVQYIENQIIQYRNTLARYGINSLEFNTALGKLKEYIQQYGVAGRETPDEGKHKAAFDAFLNCIHKRPLDMNPIEKTLEHTLRKIEWDIHRALFRIKQQNGQESTPQAARPPARAKSVFKGLFSSNVKRSRLKDLSDQMYSVHENQESMPEHHAHEPLSPARALLVHHKKLTPEEQRFVRQPDEAEDQYIARLCEYINKSIHPDHKEEEALEAGHTATIGAFLHFIKRHPSAMKEYISMRRSDYLIWIHNAVINERFYKLSIGCHNEPNVRIISISCRLRNVPMHWSIAKQFLEADSYPVKQIPLHARKFQHNSNSIDFIQTALNDFLDVGITAAEFESKNSEATDRFLERLDAQEYLTQNIMYNMNCLITSNPQIIHALKRFSLQAVENFKDSHLIIVVYRGIDPSETDQIRRRKAAGINFNHANVHAGRLKEDHYDNMKANLLLNRLLDWINGNSAAFEKKYNENFRLFDKWIKNSAVINVNHDDQAIFLMGPKLMEAALSHARQSRSTIIQTNRNGIPYVQLHANEYYRIWPSSSSPDATDSFASATSSLRGFIPSPREPPPRPPSDRAHIEPRRTPRPTWPIDYRENQTRLRTDPYSTSDDEFQVPIPLPAAGMHIDPLQLGASAERVGYYSQAQEQLPSQIHGQPAPSTSGRRDTSPPRERVGGRPSSHLLHDSDAENARKVTMLRAEYAARFNSQSATEDNHVHSERVDSNHSERQSRPMHEPGKGREQMNDDAHTTIGSRRSQSSQPVVIQVTLKTDEQQQHADRDEMHEFEPERRGPETVPRRMTQSLDRESRAIEPRPLTGSEQQYRHLNAKPLSYGRSGDNPLSTPEYWQGNVSTMPFDRQTPNTPMVAHRGIHPAFESRLNVYNEAEAAAAAEANLESSVPRSIGIRSNAPSPKLSGSIEQHLQPSTLLHSSSSSAYSRSDGLDHTSPSRLITHSPSLPPTQQNSLQQLQTQISTWFSEFDMNIKTQGDQIWHEITTRNRYNGDASLIGYTLGMFLSKTYQRVEQMNLPKEIKSEIIKIASTRYQLVDQEGNYIPFETQYYGTVENHNKLYIQCAIMVLEIAHRWKQFQENASPLAWV